VHRRNLKLSPLKTGLLETYGILGEMSRISGDSRISKQILGISENRKNMPFTADKNTLPRKNCYHRFANPVPPVFPGQ
jgi:hypothetical protein